jgi:nitroreductase
MLDVGISMEHRVLRATELGLGTCWLAGYDEVKMRAALGIPEGVKVVAMTPLGYPADRPSLRDSITHAIAGSKNRKPLEEIVHREKW